MACKKCDPHEICEECPEWIFTLADLIMCMMGLFVVLWVLKTEGNPGPPTAGGATAAAKTPAEKQEAAEQREREIIASIRLAFGDTPIPGSIDLLQMEMSRQVQLKLNGPGEKGRTTEEPVDAQGTDLQVTSPRPSKTAAVGTPLGFARGSSEIDTASRLRLKNFAEQIRGHSQIIMIKGHTSLDDLPENATPQEKLDLSLRRAQAVADVMTEMHVAPEVLRVQGASTFEPIKQRDYSPNGQSRNRRVEVESTSTLVQDLVGAK